ncbi:MAG: toxin-antitoxin system TumE family protein [Candidatus Kapaibacteriota bacterium]
MTPQERLQAAEARYSSIIAEVRIAEMEIFGAVSVLNADIVFADASRLIIRDYTFLATPRKYSFHYQDADNTLIFRYDNEAHHKHLPTFPFHKHTPFGVIASPEVLLDEVLKEIATRFPPPTALP